MEALIKKAATALAASKNVAALTGAGSSVESGIPPFRGKGGVWETFDPMAYAHIDAFQKDPEKIWREFLKLFKETLDGATPNMAHKGLARLETLGCLNTIITQNVDGLHQMAGNTDVIEFHGTFAWYHCMNCGIRCRSSRIDSARMPPRCECGGIYRPDCVFFGEMIPPHLLRRSEQAASECDIMLVVGTSAVVQPAAIMPVVAKNSGAEIIEINPEQTPLTGQVSDYLIKGNAGEVLSRIVKELEKQMNTPIHSSTPPGKDG
jgi:NAD-dependent deacetylase